MREFIKICGGLFVISGMIGCFFAVLGAISATIGGMGGIYGMGAFGMVFGAAGVTLVGGTAYVLCLIDERLERLTDGKEHPADHESADAPLVSGPVYQHTPKLDP